MDIEHAYVNAYLEITKDTLHEQLALILQLKTQLKNVSDVATERDRIIGEQNKIIAELDALLGEKEKTVRELANANAQLLHENEAAKQKSTHIESCLKTVVDLKKAIQEKEATIDVLEKKLWPSKKTINRKKKTVEEPVKEVITGKLPDDDF